MAGPSFEVSVLDLAPVVSGSTAGEALRNTMRLAVATERLGYGRYWLAEHHNMPGIASSAPAVMIGQVAAATSRMRVGSGGVMLPNHPSLVVAEQFGTLEALYPGRIDLGIGRAPGTDPRTAQALRRSSGPLSAAEFPEQLAELIEYFGEQREDGGIRAVPAPGYEPHVWLLGSSGYSAQTAGLLGLPFAFAHHFSAANTLPALELYRDNFRPSRRLSEPYAMVAAAVVCADTDDEAWRLAAPSALNFVRLRQGMPGPLPTVAEAAEYAYTAMERQFMQERLAEQIIGDPSTVRQGIDQLMGRTEAQELMITTMVPDAEARLRSYELVAKLLDLAGSVDEPPKEPPA